MTTAELNSADPDLLALDADAHGFYVMYQGKLLSCKAIHGFGLVVFSTAYATDHHGRRFMWRQNGRWETSGGEEVLEMHEVLERWFGHVKDNKMLGEQETNLLFKQRPDLRRIILGKIQKIPAFAPESGPSYNALVTSNETLTTELRRVRAELDAKHAQWQAATESHAEERSLRQAMDVLRERMRAHCAARYASDVELQAMFAQWHSALAQIGTSGASTPPKPRA